MNIVRLRALLAAVLILIISACSQTPADLNAPTLELQFGTRGYDAVTDMTYGKALTLYAVGTLDSRYESRNGRYVQSQDAFVRRYDRSGNLVWEKYLDIEPAYENDDYHAGYVPRLMARAVAVDGNGNALVAWSGDYQAYTYDANNNRYDYQVVASFDYLTKYSPTGKKVWRVYTNSALTDLALDSGGNIYGTSETALTKYTSGGSQAWTRSQSVASSGVTVSSTNNVYIARWDGAVAKYSASGTRLWFKTGQLDGYNWLGRYNGGEPYRIVAGLADELYVTGTRLSSSSEGCDAGYTIDYFTMRVFRLSNTGTRQWVKNVANGAIEAGEDCQGEDYDSLSGLGVTADNKGNVYIAGFQGSFNQDGFVAKYSRAGARSWKKAFGTTQDDAAKAVASYDGSEVFVGGVTNGFLVHRQLGGGDAFMREVNSSGNLVWAR